MRSLYFLLICCFLPGRSASQAAPFSHRLHLQMNLACTACHAAAATSASAQDNLLPPAAVCRQCHQDGRQAGAPLPAGPAPVVQFSHALHLRMGNLTPLFAKAIDSGNYLQPSTSVRPLLHATNACEACHRGMEQSDQVTSAAMPQMADCLVCHTVIDNPWSCTACHAKDASLQPASHATPHFLDTHSTGKLNLDKTTCAVCHGREFTCMGCH
jgi:hypothetical protein